jgi:hypothetical protein
MKRIKKAILLMVRNRAHRWKKTRLFYWADERLYPLRSITVMPVLYYRWLYIAGMRLAEFSVFQRLANWTIHTIPLHIRFKVA